MATIDYDEMLNRIIELIKADDTLDSATIDGMVKRLQDLNALATAQFLTRKINTGNGLNGGGDLSADRTISLDNGVVASLAKADNAVTPTALDSALSAYLTKAAAADAYATKAQAKQVFVIPFTHPGTVNGAVTSPQIRLPKTSTLTDITAAVDTAGSELKVETTGGASASVTVSASQTSNVVTGLNVSVTGPLRVKLTSTSATGTTVLLRFTEV